MERPSRDGAGNGSEDRPAFTKEGEVKIPKDFPVRPLRRGTVRKGRMTCGTCGMSWDDDKPTAWTPVPGGRCPFEYYHKETK